MNEQALPIETVVKPWGKIAAIHWRDGERYYMLVDQQGDVSLMPSGVVEEGAHIAGEKYGS